jgi:hypothetical protein
MQQQVSSTVVTRSQMAAAALPMLPLPMLLLLLPMLLLLPPGPLRQLYQPLATLTCSSQTVRRF